MCAEWLCSMRLESILSLALRVLRRFDTIWSWATNLMLIREATIITFILKFLIKKNISILWAMSLNIMINAEIKDSHVMKESTYSCKKSKWRIEADQSRQLLYPPRLLKDNILAGFFFFFCKIDTSHAFKYFIKLIRASTQELKNKRN